MGDMNRVGAVIVAAGNGTRLPSLVPKPMLVLNGQSILERAVSAFERWEAINDIVVVVRAADLEDMRGHLRDRAGSHVTAVVPGGATRRASVAAGLAAIPDADWVVVHDGVRPFVSEALIVRVFEGAQATGAATAALPVFDTLKAVEGDRVERTVDRSGLYSVQTPQAFRAPLLREAHRRMPDEKPVTDDAAMVEWLGTQVTIVPGDPINFKITTPADFDLARRIAESTALTQIGFGYDIHRLVSDRPLVLGGVRIPYDRGLEGHSDADVLTHAVMDALLGAAGEEDIGHAFPPTDPTYKDADSLDLLRQVVARVRRAGWMVVNVDTVLVAEAPPLAPHAQAMRARLAAALNVSPDQIAIKATTAEGLGPVGNGQGISAQAVAMLRRIT